MDAIEQPKRKSPAPKIAEGLPDNPTHQPPQMKGLKEKFDSLEEELKRLRAAVATNKTLLVLAVTASKAFIDQCDREGLGMQTVTDHRKRIDKFFEAVSRAGENTND